MRRSNGPHVSREGESHALSCAWEGVFKEKVGTSFRTPPPSFFPISPPPQLFKNRVIFYPFQLIAVLPPSLHRPHLTYENTSPPPPIEQSELGSPTVEPSNPRTLEPSNPPKEFNSSLLASLFSPFPSSSTPPTIGSLTPSFHRSLRLPRRPPTFRRR